jgi:hypothetical protein
MPEHLPESEGCRKPKVAGIRQPFPDRCRNPKDAGMFNQEKDAGASAGIRRMPELPNMPEHPA